MIKFLGISISVLLCGVLIKDKNRPIAVVLSIAGACILLGTAVGEIREIALRVTEISSSVPSGAEYIKLMMKVLAITLLTQLVSDICRDNGEGALASMTEIVAKVVVIALVLPLFETVITIVSGLVK